MRLARVEKIIKTTPLIGVIFVVLAGIYLGGCRNRQPGKDGSDPTQTAPRGKPNLSGTYSSDTGNEGAVFVEVVDDGDSLYLIGEIEGQLFVASAPKKMVAKGVIMNTSGQTAPIEIEPASGNQSIRIKSAAFRDLELNADPGISTTPPSGPISGKFVANDQDVELAELNVVQHGDLITGTGLVLDSSVGFVGFAEEAGGINGHLVYADGTRTQIKIKSLSHTELEVTVHGGRIHLMKQ